MSPSLTPRSSRRLVGRLAAATAVTLIAAALTGCSAGGSDPNTITFLSWDNASIMGPVIAEFEKENPRYHVDVQYAPPVAQYIQKLQTQLGSGSAPDVFIITAENKKQLIDGGLVQDLSGEPWAGNLADSAKQTYTRDGKLYGSAIASWAGGILVNEDILAKEGVTQFPTTWEGFIALCKKLKTDGVTPYIEPADSVTQTLSALLGLRNQNIYGGRMDQQIWNGDLTFDQAWTPAVEAWNELFTEGILDSSAAGLKYDQAVQEFQQGNIAMMANASWGLGSLLAGAPGLNVTFEPVPGVGSEGTFWQGAVSPGLALNTKAKNPEAAKAFIAWLSTKAGVQAYQQVTKTITTTKDFDPPLGPQLATMSTAVRNGQFYLPVVSWVDHNDALGTQATALVQQLASGQIKPEDVGKGMDAKLASVR